MAALMVRRKGYKRKGYTRKSYVRKGGIHVEGTHVSGSEIGPTTYKTKDVGAPGRGKKLIEIKGKLEGYHVNLPAEERHTILRKNIRKYGVGSVWRKLNAQVNLRLRAKPSETARIEAREIFRKDRDWVASSFGTKELTPVKAIRKWKSMSPRARAKAMPGGPSIKTVR